MALTTQLAAVNTMLGYIGEAPVNSISNTSELPVSAANAVTILDETSKEVQSAGWHFNTTKEYVLSPVNNAITLPSTTLQVDHEGTEDVDLVQRGLSLYDRKNRTSTFTKDIKVTIVEELVWDSLPEQARRYITLKATLQSRLVGSTELEALILRDEFAAKANLERSEGANADRTIFDNYDASSRIGVNRNISIY